MNMVVVCDNCGAVNEDHYNYCYNCGFPLKEHLRREEAQRLMGLSFVFESLGLIDDTIRAYEQILKSYPNYADIRYKAALAYEARGDYEQAIEHLRKALEINPNYIQARIKLGEIYTVLGRFQEALVEFKTALATRPKYTYADVHNNIGYLYERLGDIKQAKRYYRRAISLNPRFGKAYYNLANVLLDQKKYGEAIEMYRKAIESGFNTPEVHNNLGLALMRSGDVEGAEREFIEAIKLDPRIIHAYINLAELYAESGSNDKLAGVLADLRDRFPTSVELRRLLQRLRKRGISLKELAKEESSRDELPQHGSD